MFTPTWVWRCQHDDLSSEKEPNPLINTWVMGKDCPGQSKVLEKLDSDEPIGQEGQISLTNFSPELFWLLRRDTGHWGDDWASRAGEQNPPVIVSQELLWNHSHAQDIPFHLLSWLFLRAVSFFSNYFFTNQMKSLHSHRALITLCNFLVVTHKNVSNKNNKGWWCICGRNCKAKGLLCMCHHFLRCITEV